MRAILLITFLVMAGGCSYNVAPTASPASNIYSSYDEPIPGTWALIVDESSTYINREVKPSTHLCSAHNYPFDTGDSLSASIQQTMSQVFENIDTRTSVPNKSGPNADNYSGYLIVTLDSFNPRLSCSPGFWSGTCTGSVDLSLGVDAKKFNGESFRTGVGSTKTSDTSGGCDSGADALAESYRLSVKDAMERLAERVSNSQRLR